MWIPTILEYSAILNELNGKAAGLLTITVGPPLSVSVSWNSIAARATGDVMMMANDDQVYCQKGWDTRLNEVISIYSDGIYCIWFNDGINSWKHCAFPIVSRTWYPTLGYFTPGIFKFLYNDTWIMDVARRLNRLHYIPDVRVDHLHYTVNKSEFDDTYKRNIKSGTQLTNVEIDLTVYENTGPVRQRDADRLEQIPSGRNRPRRRICFNIKLLEQTQRP